MHRSPLLLLAACCCLLALPARAHVEADLSMATWGELRLDDGVAHVQVSAPAEFLLGDAKVGAEAFDERWLEALVRAVMASLDAAGVEHTGVIPWVIPPDDPLGEPVPLVSLLPAVKPPAPKPGEPSYGEDGAAAEAGPLVGLGASPGRRPAGALSGKVVYVAQGHGFTWSRVLGRWATQRGNTNDYVEDLGNAEAINQVLVHYLRNAGATVFPLRSPDLQRERVIVDAEPGGVGRTEGEGRYEEWGSGWTDSTAAGYGVSPAGLQPGDNPHARGGTRVARATPGDATAWARWTPRIPKAGRYGVSVSYAQGSNRARDAHYVVRHPGGESHLRVDQERHGGTWVHLGDFWFDAGEDPERGSVTLLNDSSLEPDGFVGADAVRFGGGLGVVERGTGSGVANSPRSGRPLWEEGCRYNAQVNGAPTSAYDARDSDNSDDVVCRSRYVAWQNEAGEDSVFVSWHTNAPDPARGTVSFVYGPNPPDGTYQYAATDGSDLLVRMLHGEIVDDIRATFDPDWRDRGVRTAYFGELNPGHNPEMPQALVEVAFHDTPDDAAFLRRPRFRHVVARAFMQGIVRYFAARDEIPARLLPDPPEALRAVALGDGRVRLSWQPPPTDPAGGDAPTGYRVYRSAHGRAFDDGAPVPGGATTVDLPLAPGELAFFRVSATNAGGESFPTPTVPARAACEGDAVGLLVLGFYRLDESSMPREDLSPFALGVVPRYLADEMNTYDYLVDHARSFAAAGVAFDGAEAAAVEDGRVSLGRYRFVDWQLGEESTVDQTLTPTEQGVVADWLADGGGRLLVLSGAEIGWDLGALGAAADQDFMITWLGATYGADDGDSYRLRPLAGALGGRLDGLEPFALDDGRGPAYDVRFPDVLVPVDGAEAIVAYDSGAGAAATYYQGAGFATAFFGFPLEALPDPAARSALVAATLRHARIDAGHGECAPIEPPADPAPDAGADSGGPADHAGTSDPGVTPDATPDPGVTADTVAGSDTVTPVDPGSPLDTATDPDTASPFDTAPPADNATGSDTAPGSDTATRVDAAVLSETATGADTSAASDSAAGAETTGPRRDVAGVGPRGVTSTGSGGCTPGPASWPILFAALAALRRGRAHGRRVARCGRS